MNGGTVRRTSVLIALAATMLLLAAAPAAAHTRAQAASNLQSSVTAAPELDGVRWHLYAGGDLIEVVHTGAQELVVLGYEGEPYLRIGPDGVFTNRNSPATYLNAERYADVAVPPRADPTADPEWTQVSTTPSYAWHDHRVHWMSPQAPPAVREAGPGTPVHVLDWTIPVLHGGEPHEVHGELRWVPGAPWGLWLLAGLAVTAVAGLGLRRRPRTVAALVRPAAATVAVVALLNTVHFADELLAWPAPTLDVLFGVFHTALFVGVGLVGAAVAWRGRQGPILSLGIASGAVLFHQGLLQVTLLSSSQLPTIWPPGLLRFAVAASIGQALVVAPVIVAALRTDSSPAAGGTERPAADLPLPAPGRGEAVTAPVAAAPLPTSRRPQSIKELHP
jgi:hypothetical protein